MKLIQSFIIETLNSIPQTFFSSSDLPSYKINYIGSLRHQESANSLTTELSQNLGGGRMTPIIRTELADGGIVNDVMDDSTSGFLSAKFITHSQRHSAVSMNSDCKCCGGE